MTAPTPRKFTVGQVMTVLAGGSGVRVFCSWGETLDVLGWLLQDVPLAEKIVPAIEAARPGVAEQHPELAKVKAPPARASDTTVLKWLADLSEEHGNLLELVPVVEAPKRRP
jgi:hypothetical protein